MIAHILIARMSPRAGLLAVVLAAILVSMISTHEGLFFLCTNGPVGLFLGVCRHLRIGRAATSVISGLALTSTLSLMSFVVGIPVLWIPLPGPLSAQLALLALFSTAYSALYMYLADFAFAVLARVSPVRDEGPRRA